MATARVASLSTAGTFEPVPVKDFPEHVKRMHANDDFLFTEEYAVRREEEREGEREEREGERGRERGGRGEGLQNHTLKYQRRTGGRKGGREGG